MAAWIPDNEGNLTAEKGDNAETLSKFLGVKQEDANKILTSQGKTDVKEGDKVTLDNVYTKSIKNSKSDYTLDAAIAGTSKTRETPEDNYNCWGAAIAGSQGKDINKTVGIPSPDTFNADLIVNYNPIASQDAQFGQTVLRFATPENNETQHGAVFYGASNDGTKYVYTKNGWLLKPEVMKLTDLQTKIPSYGQVKGIISSDSGYYQPQK